MFLTKYFVPTNLMPVRKPALCILWVIPLREQWEGKFTPQPSVPSLFPLFSRSCLLLPLFSPGPEMPCFSHLWFCAAALEAQRLSEGYLWVRVIWWLLFNRSPFRRGWIIWGPGHLQCLIYTLVKSRSFDFLSDGSSPPKYFICLLFVQSLAHASAASLLPVSSLENRGGGN